MALKIVRPSELEEPPVDVRGLLKLLSEELRDENYATAAFLSRELLEFCRKRSGTDPLPSPGLVGLASDLVYLTNHRSLWELHPQAYRELLGRVATRRAYNLESYGVCLTYEPVRLDKLTPDDAHFEMKVLHD